MNWTSGEDAGEVGASGGDLVERIYREHGDALRRFVLRSAPDDPSCAEDIVQETVLRVWRAAPRITGSLRGYLYRTARNVMVDAYRRSAVRPPLAPTDGEADLLPDAADPIEELLGRLLMEEALLRLSAEHREVVVALHYRRETLAEAAERLRIPVGTVKSRAHYALLTLRGVLTAMGVER
ncbi:sigma-70 family RNA polymerase sigma factor [Arthrobacter ginkgonis]|uniref:sigma-70 family RNA polymerase sigma factor n=1 Tax=Arthrobacter ginkgonis TaxID=1630594 RepID=UPI0031ECBF57